MELKFDSYSNSFLRSKRRGGSGKGKSKKKGKNLRSQMLKVVMPQLSGVLGEELQAAIAAQDGARAERVIIRIAKSVRQKVESDKK